MQYLNFNIQGKLFNLPAGPVQVAAGAEIRHQELEQTSNSDPAIWADPATGPAARAAYFSGIRGVPAAALQFMSINVGLANGKQDVSEAYTEVSLPLLSDVPLAKDLSLDLAARFTDYKTSGQVTTWKASGGWTPFDGVRFRGSQSRDIAAPSLSDLYAGENLVIGQFNDPLTGINATVPTSSSGNPAVGPESADTTTFGVVFQPDAIPGLTFSIDAYRIEIADAIGTQNAIQQAADCHASGGTAPVCTLIDRPFPYSNTTAANFPTKIRVVPQNLAELVTQGIDFEATYTFPVDMLGGDIELRAFVNHLDTYDTQGAASQPVIHRAGRITSDGEPIGLPEWKGLLSQTYSNDRLSLSLTERFTGEYVYGSPTQVFAKPINAPSKVYLDLNATYDFDEDNKVQGFVNVQNLLDTDPKNMGLTLIQNLSVDTDKTMYDVVGRYFTAGVRMNF
jgi:outer membrane receptor protein involved in Fe transport